MITWYKYYCMERPAGPGAVPAKGLVKYDPDDKGGRYGAVYYRVKLTADDLVNYELISGGIYQRKREAYE